MLRMVDCVERADIYSVEYSANKSYNKSYQYKVRACRGNELLRFFRPGDGLGRGPRPACEFQDHFCSSSSILTAPMPIPCPGIL